ncbi:MAG: ABC transporter ATP-binding protein [Porticoccaceae bacterium]
MPSLRIGPSPSLRNATAPIAANGPAGSAIRAADRASPPLKRGAISLRNVGISFGADRRRFALCDVSLDIAPGEFAAFLGPSGCGKTTLLNLVGGMLQPTEGTVRIDGDAVREPTPRCNVVFQQHSLFAWMTVLDNVAFGPRALGLAEPESVARALLRLVGLEDFAAAYPATLSGGMQQRVAIARALATSPDVLLMDEPFGALDAQTRSIMQEELARLRHTFAPTVIFVTHDVDEALLLADRVFVMGVNPGSIKAVIDVDAELPSRNRREHDSASLSLRSRVLGLIREESLKVFNR